MKVAAHASRIQSSDTVTLYQDKYRIESTRLRGWNYGTRGWYFVTICAFNRLNIFGEIIEGDVHLATIGQIAESDLQTLADHYSNVEIDAHVVMPNHVHAIVMIDGDHNFFAERQAESAFAAERVRLPRDGISLCDRPLL